MTYEPSGRGASAEIPARRLADMAEPPQPGAAAAGHAPDSLRLQILSTEHWSLLATRSLTWNETFARAQMFLSALAGAVVALALVAQATTFGEGFTTFALVILPVVAFLGLSTFLRLVAANNDENRWVVGMNRIRSAYVELAPELKPYFVTAYHDDPRGVMLTGGWGDFPTIFGLVTTPGLVAVIDGVVVAVVAFLAALKTGLASPLAGALAGFVFVTWVVALMLYVARDRRRHMGLLRSISPTPSDEA